MKSQQISEALRGQHITVNGIKFPLENLASGCLITGGIGSGKTITWLNQLALQLAQHSFEAERKSAIIYFNLKGHGAAHFMELLPEDRKKDVIHLHEKSDYALDLFNPTYWSSHTECRAACVAWLEEILVQATNSADSIDHDHAFWTLQRLRILNNLAHTQIEGIAVEADDLRIVDMLVRNVLDSLLARLKHFLAYINDARFNRDVGNFDRTLKEAGLTKADITFLKTWVSDYLQKRHAKRPAAAFEQFMVFSKMILEQISSSWNPKTDFLPFRIFLNRLMHQSRENLFDVVLQYRFLAESTWSCISAELGALCNLFDQEPLSTLLHPGKKLVSIEEVIDKGKILVIDCPLADSGGASRTALIAIKTAITNRLLCRYLMRNKYSKQVNRIRPVGLFIDEFHSITTRGIVEGDDLFVSRCRELGIISAFATQNISLLRGVLQDRHRVFGMISNLKNKIFCSNDDAQTNEHASMSMGIHHGESSFVGIPWQRDKRILDALKSSSGEPYMLVPPWNFVNMDVGEAYVITADAAAYHVNANHRNSAPAVKKLRDSNGVDSTTLP